MAVVIDEPTDVLTGTAVTPEERRSVTLSAEPDVAEVAIELAIWLSGLESFLTGGSTAAATEFRLVRSVLERCVTLNVHLTAYGCPNVLDDEEIVDLAAALRESIQLTACMLRAEPVRTGEIRAWRRALLDRLRDAAAFQKLIKDAEDNGDRYLPEPLKNFAGGPSAKSEEEAELALVLPRFGKILKWLSVVGRMLEADEPLKPAMLIFARVNEQVSDLIGYIDSRLQRFPNEDAELFASLDAASYTASIELKKVYSAEFAGLIGLRPTPAIFAAMETAYSMLNESFQQTLTGLARTIDPSINAASLFPNSKVNFERSLVLRQELWDLVQMTKTAENEPEKHQTEELNDALRKFMDGTAHFLFYKDTETVERFVDEILVTKQTKDLVPILHRFGAYLETLFGHVNLRAALENHPFEP